MNGADDYKKAFRKSFDQLSYRRNWHEAFRDFIEIAACTAHQQPYHEGVLIKDADFERIEQRYMETIKKYDAKELDSIAALYALSVMALRDTKEDFIGQIYMDLGISNKFNGEFFTPVHVCRMMAQMQMHGASEVIERQGIIRVSEPCCGAGVMLIEAANALRDDGHDPRGVMWFQAIDINRTCFNMAYFQLSVLQLVGEVVHGDTLRMEWWERRETPMWKIIRERNAIPQEPLPEFKPLPPPPPVVAKVKNQMAFEF